MTIPSDLKLDPARRGPAGTELMGVSVAVPLKECQDQMTGQPWSEQDWRDFIQDSQPQLLQMLRTHVGNATPVTEPQMNVDGPHADPLQGQLYVMTAAAWFFPASLPVDCSAYRARASSRG